MHGRSVLVIGALAAAGLAATGVAAYGGMPIETHLLLALSSFFLLVLAHSWTVLYLYGTGKAMREVVAEAGLATDLVEPGPSAAKRALPWALGLLVLLAVNTVIGGRAYTRASPAWVHAALAWGLFLAQAAAVAVEARLLAVHHRRMAAINALLRA